jgi:hypothetical protein
MKYITLLLLIAIAIAAPAADKMSYVPVFNLLCRVILPITQLEFTPVILT